MALYLASSRTTTVLLQSNDSIHVRVWVSPYVPHEEVTVNTIEGFVTDLFLSDDLLMFEMSQYDFSNLPWFSCLSRVQELGLQVAHMKALPCQTFVTLASKNPMKNFKALAHGLDKRSPVKVYVKEKGAFVPWRK